MTHLKWEDGFDVDVHGPSYVWRPPGLRCAEVAHATADDKKPCRRTCTTTTRNTKTQCTHTLNRTY